ncbi:alpha/beta fold hydrolase [Amycolatopsis sp. NPDC059027]|uniref:alpha/beta fold hydrolase n=1 Tax=unclassified Amycolatopsis TaxID=2618356 RepID=UPI00366A854F
MASTRRDMLKLGAAAIAAGAATMAPQAASAAPAGFERLRIRTRAGTFDALAAGPQSGRPVLLLHGFPESSLEWRAQLTALGAAGFRAVAPDQRGYSPGVRPARIDAYRLDNAVSDVRGIANTLGWNRFDVVGHDWGACVAWIAARYPGRIRKLAAVSVPHPAAFAEALRADPAQREASKYMDGFREPAPGPENRILAAGPPKLDGVPREICEEYFARLSEPGALTAALNWYRANDFAGYEQCVRVPALFIAGDDPMVAPSGILNTRRWVTGPYRLERLTGVGHFVPESAPETVSRLLLDHLCPV